MTITLALSLTDGVHAALVEEADKLGLEPTVHAVRILEDHLLRQGLLDEDVKRDILLGRSLIERAVTTALTIVESGGFRSSITFDAIQAVSQDPSWLSDYRTLVRDDPYKTGNPRKQTINQNLGYFIKKATGAKSLINSNGRPANVKVKGSIIQSYTPLVR